MAIYGDNGTRYVTYRYDSWGNHTPAYHNGGGSITAIANNPFRYRSYYYDTDLNLYYLGSRYYDPAICRFINMDAIGVINASPTALTDKNLYAYCDNNPVMRVDEDGEFWHILGGALLGTVAGVLTKVVANFVSGKKITADLFTAGVAGAISGGLAASSIGLIGQCIGNALIGAANNVADQFNGIFAGTKTDGFDVGSVLVDGAIGAVAGLAGDAGAGNKGLTSIALTNLRRSWNTFTHQGIKPALSVFGKGMAYFGKSARHMLQPLSMAIKNSSVSIIINNAIKDIIP